MILAVFQCNVKVDIILCDIGTLYKQYFLCTCNDTLFDCRNIIGSAVRKGFFLKVTAAESVTAYEYYKGIQSDSFKAGRIQHS